MLQAVNETGRALNITATNTTLVDVKLLGFFCSSTTSGTIKVADAKQTLANTFSPTGGTFYALPFQTVGLLTVTIAGTALDVTLSYIP